MPNNDVNKMRELLAPGDLNKFNPGKYFSEIEFTEPATPYSDEDKEALVQMLFFCDYLTMHVQNPERENFILPENTSFFATLRTNFRSLPGWQEVEEVAGQGFVYYTDLMQFFFRFYKPRPPE